MEEIGEEPQESTNHSQVPNFQIFLPFPSFYALCQIFLTVTPPMGIFFNNSFYNFQTD